MTRNVFAGKAVIAELRGTGSGVGDMVTWKTSDPASGTVVAEVKRQFAASFKRPMKEAANCFRSGRYWADATGMSEPVPKKR